MNERTASIITNGLSSAAGRIAKAATRAGFRSNVFQGIHGLVLNHIQYHCTNPLHTRTIAVAGMGEIGRKTVAVLQENTPANILRFNRTVQTNDKGILPLDSLNDHLPNIHILVTATGARTPVFTPESLQLKLRKLPLHIIDIGIPRQVDPVVTRHPGITLITVDDLDPGTGPDPTAETTMEQEIETEVARFRRFCLARDMVGLLDTIHQKRKDYIRRVIPALLDRELSGIGRSDKKRIETAMQQVIREYANDIFNSIHTALDDYRSA